MFGAAKSRGEISIRSVISLVILFALIHGSVKVAPLYVKYYFFRNAVREYSKSAETTSNYQVLQDVLAKSRELDLPVTEKNVEMERVRGESFRIQVRYTVEVKFLWGFYRQFAFNCEGKTLFAGP